MMQITRLILFYQNPVLFYFIREHITVAMLHCKHYVLLNTNYVNSRAELCNGIYSTSTVAIFDGLTYDSDPV